MCKILHGDDFEDCLEGEDYHEDVVDEFNDRDDPQRHDVPLDGEHHCVADDAAHDKEIEGFVGHDVDAEVAERVVSVHSA